MSQCANEAFTRKKFFHWGVSIGSRTGPDAAAFASASFASALLARVYLRYLTEYSSFPVKAFAANMKSLNCRGGFMIGSIISESQPASTDSDTKVKLRSLRSGN